MSFGFAALGLWTIVIGVVLIASAGRLTRVFIGRSGTPIGGQHRAFAIALRLLGVFAIWLSVCVLAAGTWPGQAAWLMTIGVVVGCGIMIVIVISFVKAVRANGRPS